MPCKYHPKETAIDKCEDCHKSVCMHCKRIYREHLSGIKYSHKVEKRITLCPVCYYTRFQKKSFGDNICQTLVGIILSIPTLKMIWGARNIPIPYMVFFGIIVFAGFLLVGKGMKGVFTLLYEKQKARQECDDFLDSLIFKVQKKSDHGKVRPKNEKPYFHHRKYEYLFCQQCGNKMEFKAEFCPACGDPSDDEKRLLN